MHHQTVDLYRSTKNLYSPSALFAYDIAYVVSNIYTQDYDMVAQRNRKAVSGRRSKAKRRGGKQNSGRNAAQLASKLRARGSAAFGR